MDVFTDGKNKITLTQQDFKAQGGEGAVYVKDGTAYKIYSDPAKMIAPAKIGELSALTLPAILRPRDVLRDGQAKPIGYTMQSVPDAVTLCQTFTRSFRDRRQLTPDRVFVLVRQLEEGVRHVHSHGILIVDLNEMNFLVDDPLENVYFIDVDSYQTPNFAATALMDSVRDRHTTGFSEGTDWFSFGIVSFQMFIGIHPYKGKHPFLKTLDARMQRNLSVFHPDVSLPATCLPFAVIPEAYQDWYKAVFDDGKRLAPPTTLRSVITIAPQVQRVQGSHHFDIELVQEFDGEIIYYSNGITVTTEGIYLQGRKCADGVAAGLAVGITGGHAIAARVDQGRVILTDLRTRQVIPTEIAGEQVMGSDGRLYVKQGTALTELEFIATASRTLAHAKVVGSVLANATQTFEGVALQSLLGATYASLLPRAAACYQVRLRELDGYRVLDARLLGSVLMIVGSKGGQYDRFILRFDRDYRNYDVGVEPDVATYGINFAVLDSGVCLHLNADEELELFPARPGTAGRKIVADPALAGDCRLFKSGTQVLFARGNRLYKITMRQESP